MIEAGEVQHTMQHQDLQLLFGIVSQIAGLLFGSIEGDCDFSQRDAAGRNACRVRKGQNVGRIIPVAKLAVEPSRLSIARDETREGPAARNFGFEHLSELPQLAPCDSTRGYFI